MKRLTAGVVAVAAALSLSTAAASAADSSSDAAARIKDWFASAEADFDLGVNIAENGTSDPHAGSTDSSSKITKDWDSEEKQGSAKAHLDFYGSSYKNDIKNNYATGTTADILWGVGIAAAVLGLVGAAINSGVIPGLSLPQLHF